MIAFLFSKRLITSAAILLTACGGSPKLELGATHFYNRVRAPSAPQLAGTYEMSGSFADVIATGAKVTIEQPPESGKPGLAVDLKRTSADGKLTAIGRGTVIGDHLYVAWQLGTSESVGGTMMVELLVADLETPNLEGFTLGPMFGPFSGSSAGSQVAKLAPMAEATFPILFQDYSSTVQRNLYLRRYQHQLYASLAGPRGRNAAGPALLDGQTRLVGAILSENQRSIPQVAVGIYTIDGARISGSTVFMDNTDENVPPNGGRGGTLRMEAQAERWDREGGIATAGTAQTPDECGAAVTAALKVFEPQMKKALGDAFEESYPKFVTGMTASCVETRWSAAATVCMKEATTGQELKHCDRLLTEQQKEDGRMRMKALEQERQAGANDATPEP
jgi:hypothetical protein